MDWFLNIFRVHIPGEYLVIGLYGGAVLLMLALAFLAQSKTIGTAAMLIAGGWVFSIFAYFVFDWARYCALVIMANVILAACFWRMAQREMFPAVLCVIALGELGVLIAAALASLGPFAPLLVLNRSFELTLLYVIFSSLYRIGRLHAPQGKNAPGAGYGLKFIAA